MKRLGIGAFGIIDIKEDGSLLARDDVFSMLNEILDSLNNPYDVEEVKKIIRAEGFEVKE